MDFYFYPHMGIFGDPQRVKTVWGPPCRVEAMPQLVSPQRTLDIEKNDRVRLRIRFEQAECRMKVGRRKDGQV